MKERRHAKILELISKYNIDTQEGLLDHLRREGFDVTQATVSRDIKELRLVKSLSPDGKYKYSLEKENVKDASAKFYSIFSDSAISVAYAQNIVVIKCFTGMANAVCAALDTTGWKNIVGTVAGDDTIFVLLPDEISAADFAAELKKLLR